MGVSLTESAFVVSGGAAIPLASLFSTNAAGPSPTYLILTGVDIDDYPASASQATGSLTGANGAPLPVFTVSGDSSQRAIEAVFTYQPASGRYYSATFGYFDALTYTASASTDDLMSLSVFTTNDQILAANTKWDPASLYAKAPQDFIGSATLFTDPGYKVVIPSNNPTPASLAGVASGFIGQIWNDKGCWSEAAAIAAEAGAGLPITAAYTGLQGQNQDEWVVVFDGVTGQTGNWQALVRQGDVVSLIESDGVTGHTATCLAGAGATALLVDNADFLGGSNGTIVNAAADGGSNDIIVTPLLASSEFNAVNQSSVVIYRLDAPLVTDLVDAAVINSAAGVALTGLFAASSPDGHAITEWQVYYVNASDSLSVNGSAISALGAQHAIQLASLSGVSLLAGAGSTSDTIELRAFNGSYWGDWQGLDVYAGGTAQPSNASSDAALVSFVASQNEAIRGSAGVGLLNNGMVANGDSVIGEISATLGAGINAVVLDDDMGVYSWNIDNSGQLSLFNGDSGKSVTISGATDILFDGAAQNSDGSFAHLLLVLNGADSEIARFYEAALGRVPDLAGLEYYIHEVNNGLTMSQAAQDFFASPEFTARFGSAASLTDGAYVSLLYQNVLGRTPATSELAFYENALSSSESRLSLFFDFANSQEFINRLNATNGGWLVDTALGGAATSHDLIAAQTVIAQAVTDNYLDTHLIYVGSLIDGQGYNSVGLSITRSGQDVSVTVNRAASGFTLLMSPTDKVANIAVSGATVYADSKGGDQINLVKGASGEQLILAGGGNDVAFASGVSGSATLIGFQPGSDHIDLTAFKFGSYANLLAESSVTGGMIAIAHGPIITLSGVGTLAAGDFLI